MKDSSRKRRHAARSAFRLAAGYIAVLALFIAPASSVEKKTLGPGVGKVIAETPKLPAPAELTLSECLSLGGAFVVARECDGPEYAGACRRVSDSGQIFVACLENEAE